MAEGNAQLLLDIIAQADTAGIQNLSAAGRTAIQELVEEANRVQSGGEEINPQALVAGIRRALSVIQDEIHDSAQRGFENVNLRGLETALNLLMEDAAKNFGLGIERALGETAGTAAEPSRFGARPPRPPERREEIARGVGETARRVEGTEAPQRYRVQGRFATKEQYEAEQRRVQAPAAAAGSIEAFNQARRSAVSGGTGTSDTGQRLTAAEEQAVRQFGELEGGWEQQKTVDTLLTALKRAALTSETEYLTSLNTLESVTSQLARARTEALEPEERAGLVADQLVQANEANLRIIAARSQISPEQQETASQAELARRRGRAVTTAGANVRSGLGDVGLAAGVTTSGAALEASVREVVAANQRYAENLNRIAAATSELNIARAAAITPEQRAAKAQADLASSTERNRIASATAALAEPQDITARAGAVTAGRGFTAAADIENLEAIARNENGIYDTLVRQKALRDSLNASIREEAAGVAGVGAGTGGAGGGRGVDDSHGVLGTLGSALGGFRRGQGARDVSGVAGLGGALAGGVLFNIGFAVQAGLTQAFTAAEQLDKELVSLNQEAIEIGQGDQFGSLRQNILSVSDATGVAGADVAALSQQFLGLYQNATVASAATKETAEFVAESGVAATTAGPQFAALAQNFGLSARQIGNAVITSSQTSGRRQADVLAAAADVAPVAANAGFTGNQLFGIITAATQGSALSGTEVGEGLARVIPSLQTDLSKLARDGIQFSPQAMAGNVPLALTQLITQFNNPNVNRPQITADLGGARQAQFVSSLASNPAAIADLNKNYTDNNALATRFAAVQQTVSVSLDRLRESAVNLAQTLISGGIGQGLSSIITAGGTVLTVIGDLVSGFDSFNRKLDDVPAKLAEVVIGLGLLNRVGAFTAIGSLIEKLLQLRNLGAVGNLGAAYGAGAGAAQRVGGIFASPAVRRGGAEAEPETLRQRLSRVGGAGGAVGAQQQVAQTTALTTAEAELVTARQAEVAAITRQNVLTADAATTDAELVAAQEEVTATAAAAAAAVARLGVAQAEVAATSSASTGAGLLGGLGRAGVVAGEGGGTLATAGLGGAGLAALGGPQAAVLAAVAADYVASSVLASRSSRNYSQKVDQTTNALSVLSPTDLANVAATGSTRPVATKTSAAGYTADIAGAVLTGGATLEGPLARTLERNTLGRIPGAGGVFNAITNFATSDPASLARRVPVVGGLFGTSSESRRQIARDLQAQQAFTGTQGAVGGFDPEGMTEATVTALEKVVPSNLAKSLQTALDKFQNAGTVGNFNALQKLYQGATQPGTAGATAVEDAKAEAARQANFASFTDTAGTQFQSISDVSSSFQSGYLTFSDALKDMTKVINDDAQATVEEKQQRLSDIAAMKAFQGQVAATAIAAQQSTAQYVQGADPRQLFQSFATQVQAGANANIFTPQQVVQYGEQLNQQVSGVNDFTIATTNSISTLQNLLKGGGAGFTAGEAAAINKGQIGAGIAPSQVEFPEVQRAVERNAAVDAHNAQVRASVRTAELEAAHARHPLGAADIAEITQGAGGIEAQVAIPTPPAATTNYQENIAIGQRETSLTQAATGLRVAQAQAQQQSASQIASIQTQGDQTVLSQLLNTQQLIKQAGGDASVLNPQIVQAETAIASDKVAQAQGVQTGIQQWGTFMKAANFQDPVKQAQIGISQGLNEAASLHTTIGQIEAAIASGKGVSAAEAQALSDYQTGISDLFSATQSNIQAVTSAAQSRLASQPLAADTRGVSGALQQIQAAGYTPQQLAGLVNSGKASATQANLYEGYQNAINQQFTDQTAISVQAISNAANLASAQGNNITAAVDQAKAINTQLQALASKGANARNSQQYAQLQGQLQTANLNVGAQQFQVSQAQFETAEAVATGQGNTVTATRLSLSQAERAVAYWQSLGATPGASIQLQQALSHLATARTAALQAQFEVGQSSLQTAEAVATARGDPVGAADLAVKAAEDAVNYWRKLGASPGASAQLQQALGALATAEGNSLQARVSLAETLVQEEVANNQISIAQGINVLRAQQRLAASKGNALLVEQLQTDIQNLINQGNQNAAFNLPTNLNLPTLYEVRRTEGTPRGGNYYGNTGPVNVNINIGGQADVQTAVNKLMVAVGGPPTTGFNLPIS